MSFRVFVRHKLFPSVCFEHIAPGDLNHQELDVDAREKFNGTFDNIKTANPILFVSNFHDSYTALSE